MYVNFSFSLMFIIRWFHLSSTFIQIISISMFITENLFFLSNMKIMAWYIENKLHFYYTAIIWIHGFFAQFFLLWFINNREFRRVVPATVVRQHLNKITLYLFHWRDKTWPSCFILWFCVFFRFAFVFWLVGYNANLWITCENTSKYADLLYNPFIRHLVLINLVLLSRMNAYRHIYFFLHKNNLKL